MSETVLSVLFALLGAFTAFYRLSPRFKAHVVRRKNYYKIAAPFVGIIVFFTIFAVIVSPGYPFLQTTTATRGQFGDSFGLLTSLFTGLGFAGLTITLWMQQGQFSRQATDSFFERESEAAGRYEATLHRLLELYKCCVSEVLMSVDGKACKGRDAMQTAIDRMLKTVRTHNANEIPPDVLDRYRNGLDTEADKRILDSLFLSNATIINRSFMRQARVVNTFTLLLRHMEDEAPGLVDVEHYRRLVHSQLTHIEMAYFFYVALAFKEEEELRRLLVRSKLIEMIGNVSQLQVHRYMYIHLWGYDPKQHRFERKVPFKPMAAPRPKKILKAA